jgi:hypothetical protein
MPVMPDAVPVDPVVRLVDGHVGADAATSSPLLSGSVLDEHKGALVLSNGSRIVSVPASQRQIRGWPVDPLILDEAGFIDPDIWRMGGGAPSWGSPCRRSTRPGGHRGCGSSRPS